jgi:hypothetical protein
MSTTPLVRLGRFRSAQSIARNVPRSRTSRSSWSALRVALVRIQGPRFVAGNGDEPMKKTLTLTLGALSIVDED